MSEDEAGAVVTQATIDQLWADELTRRAERAHRGETTGRDAQAVLSAIEATLRATNAKP
jgi:hypothetical protein